MRNLSVVERIGRFSKSLHINVLILEAFCKDFLNSGLVLRLDYAWSRGKYSECTLPLTSISRLTGLEQGPE